MTGLDYYNVRYYDPGVGQFLSADSVQGNAQGMDPYAYVGGNPETKTDPTGNRVVKCMPGEDCSGSDGGNGGGHGPVKCVPGEDCSSGDGNGGSGNGGGSTTPTPTPTPNKHHSGGGSTGGCGYTSILSLCVKDVAKFAQGSAEVLGSIAVLIGAVVGLFQSGGLLWALAQAFQMFASGILGVMKNGISNILNSLDGPPGKGFKIFLDIIQFAADVTSAVISGVSFLKNIFQIGKYPGKTYSKSWGGFWKVTGTYVAKGTLNATTALAVNTVGNFINSLAGIDFLANDGEQLYSDIVSN